MKFNIKYEIKADKNSFGRKKKETSFRINTQQLNSLLLFFIGLDQFEKCGSVN